MTVHLIPKFLVKEGVSGRDKRQTEVSLACSQATIHIPHSTTKGRPPAPRSADVFTDNKAGQGRRNTLKARPGPAGTQPHTQPHLRAIFIPPQRGAAPRPLIATTSVDAVSDSDWLAAAELSFGGGQIVDPLSRRGSCGG